MAVASAARRPSLARLFVGPRVGTTMIALGLVLATAAAVLVLSLGRRTRATTAAAQTVPVAFVVVATRDIPDNTRIPADAVAAKPFPAAYAPAGALSAPDAAAGKFATTRIVRDQILLESQVSATQRGSNIAAAVPPGQLAVWLPIPDLLAQTGGLRPGDRVDVLLTLGIPPAGQPAAQPAAPPTGGAAQTSGQTVQTTQLTLQNVELFFVGTAASAAAAAPTQPGGVIPSSQPAAPPGTHVAVVLLEPQDALAAKFIKDAGGSIDLALRSRDWPDKVTAEPVTLDALVNRFGFRSGAAR